MKIVFGTDGSHSSRTAGRLVADLSLSKDASVTVLSAVPEHGWVEALEEPEAPLYPWLIDFSTREEAAAHRAAEIAAAYFREHNIPVTVSIRRGSPVDAILEQAEAESAELIVVGSHGNGAMERFLIGSVSERVARYARCSVLVARRDTLRRVILAVDSSEASEHALAALTGLSLPPETRVTLLHVIHPGDLRSLLSLAPGVDSERIIDQYDRECHSRGERLVRHAHECLRAAGLEAKIEVRCGTPAEQIVATAWGEEADLVVVGAENRSALGRRFLGGVAGCVLNYAPCSVLVSRGAGEDEGPRAFATESAGGVDG
jgi:nucleotide-binding universal stress UspA family protein